MINEDGEFLDFSLILVRNEGSIGQIRTSWATIRRTVEVGLLGIRGANGQRKACRESAV